MTKSCVYNGEQVFDADVAEVERHQRFTRDVFDLGERIHSVPQYARLIQCYVTKTDCAYEGNTYRYEGTVSYTNMSEKYFEIYINEDSRPRRIKIDFLRGKEISLSDIQLGDRITYWTHLFDTVPMPEAAYIDIVAFTINETPIYTLEEYNKEHVKSFTRGRILVTVFSLVLIIIGIVILVRAYKLPKNNFTDNKKI